LGLTALFVATPFVTSALGATSGGAGVTTASLIKQTKAAIGKQSSARVEFDAISTASGATEKIVGDLGTSAGAERISDGNAVLSVRVTSTGAYVSGTPTGLTSLFRMTAAQATKLGSRWEYWKAGTTQYKDLKADVTVPSLATLLPPAKGTTMSAQGSGYVLKWTSAASSTTPALTNALIISSANLPMQETSSDASAEKTTTTISKWGETIVENAPPASRTLAASKLKG
jgi:hypothetical protein